MLTVLVLFRLLTGAGGLPGATGPFLVVAGQAGSACAVEGQAEEA